MSSSTQVSSSAKPQATRSVRSRRLMGSAWLAALGLLVGSCAESAIAPAPADPTDLSLIVVGGNNQLGTAGAELPRPLTVKAATARGKLLPGIVVNFRVTSGGGSVFAGSELTNESGLASDYWTLGPTAGEPQRLEVRGVSAEGDKAVFATFTATAFPPATARIVVQAGDSQIAMIGNPAFTAPAVLLTDSAGHPWPNVVVTFAVASGGGSVSGTTATTGLDGIASSGSWTLGAVPGVNTLTATAEGIGIAGNPVRFTAQSIQAQPRTLAAGLAHACGIASTGAAYCWGYSQYGQLGDDSTTLRYVPTPVSGGLSYSAVAAGDYYSCGLSGVGTAYCWGSGFFGQLGDGHNVNQLAPVQVTGGLTFTSLAAGANHACGLVAGGAAYCWGRNDDGQLGDGGVSWQSVPTAVTGGLTFEDLAARGNHTCGVTPGGRAYCWGLNFYGELGDGTTTSHLVPTPVLGGIDFITLALGDSYSCGVAGDGATYCWGSNMYSQLGDGTWTDRLLPTPVSGNPGLISVSAGAHHTCGFTGPGNAYCWGSGWSGELGYGGRSFKAVPTAVGGGLAFSTLTGGWEFSCGVAVDGAAYCWGTNQSGQLGDSTSADRLVPSPVAGGLTFLTNSLSAPIATPMRPQETRRASR